MWEQIRSNQIRSALLIVTLGLILLLLGFFVGIWFFDNPLVGLIIALIIWVSMNLLATSVGDKIILVASGAQKIGPQDFPRLYNIVEEMKIASGLESMPALYIVDDSSLNAFATGYSSDQAAIVVTSGLLEKLNRDELQGVIGHEIAHIKNRDIQLMVLTGILLGSIILLSKYSVRFLLFGGLGRRSTLRVLSGALRIAQWAIILAGLALIILSPFLGQLIYFSISRKREYLADASSALFTRYPEGLASALEKIQSNRNPVQRASKATAPMYISDPLIKNNRAGNLFLSTHPPIAERIRILRSMSGASYASYENSYRGVKGSRIIPEFTLALSQNEILDRRPSTSEAGNIQDRIDRAREISDFFWRKLGYRRITCSNCSNKMKLPPGYQQPTIRCFYCGHTNPSDPSQSPSLPPTP